MTRRSHLVAWASATALTWVLGTGAAQAQAPNLVMASTTSTEQSGLFSHLLPAFKQASGIDIKVVALGTGQALDMGRRGDADVLFVHDQAAEEKFVADGFGVKRFAVMYNDFVLVGPANDPVKTLWTNRDGSVVTNGQTFRDLLVGQVSSPVRWDKCMDSFAAAGVTGIIELAPAGALVGLAKRALKGVPTVAIKTPDDLAAARELIDSVG